ncbi:ABC transporter ATP-binding protein [Deinococcus ruber]|uniref:Multidrug ABC transporter permease n=1 Tax=Deinococcus ruber TaxID=1848197 RepID=A0A918FBU2_9DEIO|nr:ABC transporter ATP-binding protein [Deinococcus ruber]GGR20155.1 multidrug ABC transporter permease [Deinococcus ruber]
MPRVPEQHRSSAPRGRAPAWLPLIFWQAAWRVSPFRTGLLTVWSVWQGLQTAALALALNVLVTRLTGNGSGLQGVLWPTAGIVGLLVSQVLLGTFAGQVTAALAWRLERAQVSGLVSLLTVPRPLSSLEQGSVPADLTAARGENGSLTPDVALSTLGALTAQLVMAASSVLLLASVRWWAPLLLLPGLLVLRRWLSQETRVYRDGLEAASGGQRRAGYFRSLALTTASAREVRTFGLSGWLLEQLTGQLSAGLSDVRRRRREQVPQMIVATITLTLGYGGLTALALRDAVHGTLGAGPLVLMLQAALGLLSVVSGLENGLRFTRAAQPFAALSRARQQLEDSSEQRASTAEALPTLLHREPLVAQDLSFSYPGQEATLRNVSFSARPGQVLAVVGPNGAGKSTLMRLLARLDEPSSGRLSVGGHDARNWPLEQWRRQVAVVTQQFMRWELSVRDNVQFGCPQYPLGDDLIWTLLERAGAAEFIRGLPGGLDTVLSGSDPQGSGLSGGQWQRLATARALAAVEAGAALLILDEPTASLDVRAEMEFYRHFLQLTRGVTTVLVSHRYSTVQLADEIVVLQDGRTAERGRHADLMARGGWYARMVRQQTQAFTDTDMDTLGVPA